MLIGDGIDYEAWEQQATVEAVETKLRNLTSTGASDWANRWAELGVWVNANPPENPVTYAEWAAAGSGYWRWIKIS